MSTEQQAAHPMRPGVTGGRRGVPWTGPDATRLLAFAAAYGALTWISPAFDRFPLLQFEPAHGLAAAAVAFGPRRQWAAVTALVFAIATLGALTSFPGVAVSAATLAGLIAVAKGVPGALATRMFLRGERPPRRARRGILGLLLICILGPLAGALVSGLAGFLALVAPADPWAALTTLEGRAVIDIHGMVIAFPMASYLIRWREIGMRRESTRLLSGEVLTLTLLALVASVGQFVEPPYGFAHRALPPVIILLQMLVALRAGLVPVATLQFLTGLVAMIGLSLSWGGPRAPADLFDFHVIHGLGAAAGLLVALLARDLRDALHEAEVATHAKSLFLANMSHELRTPLNAIIGFSEVIGEEVFGPLGHPRYGEYARDIAASGRHLLGVVNDILEISRIEAHRIELRPSAMAIADVIADVVKHHAPAAIARQVELIVDVDPEAGPLIADRRAVHQMLFNLLSNAVKFTRGGRIVIHGGRHPRGVVLSVSDTGLGIPPEDLHRVLEPFERSRDTEARAIQGSGLGLTMVKVLIEAHGGDMVIRSVPGRGTQVSLIFPDPTP